MTIVVFQYKKSFPISSVGVVLYQNGSRLQLLIDYRL